MNIEDVHKNSKMKIDGIPYNVDDADFMKPGKGHAIYRLRLRNLFDNSTLDRTFHSGDKADEAVVSTAEVQYLYQEGDNYVFMDTRSFEQHFIPKQMIGDKKHYLKDGTLVTVTLLEDRIIDVAPPTFVELKVTSSATVGKTDTITAQSKSVMLETGMTIGAPTFIKEGDILKVDTRTSTYVERVNKK